MRVFVAVFVVVSLSGAVLVACGGASNAATESTNTQESSGDESVPSETVVETTVIEADGGVTTTTDVEAADAGAR